MLFRRLIPSPQCLCCIRENRKLELSHKTFGMKILYKIILHLSPINTCVNSCILPFLFSLNQHKNKVTKKLNCFKCLASLLRSMKAVLINQIILCIDFCLVCVVPTGCDEGKQRWLDKVHTITVSQSSQHHWTQPRNAERCKPVPSNWNLSLYFLIIDIQGRPDTLRTTVA